MSIGLLGFCETSLRLPDLEFSTSLFYGGYWRVRCGVASEALHGRSSRLLP